MIPFPVFIPVSNGESKEVVVVGAQQFTRDGRQISVVFLSNGKVYEYRPEGSVWCRVTDCPM